ncbi:integrase [Aliiruegeria haliotis]|uniref:Integrase n=1 Tax=Aliiruegeria haliotis TaxID=1280846 RepID=A0A2T0RPQ7_9RHOB|nr:integrase arm-type DNA-binding domain-containing protein [Aliiruegeria haliotis]PRY23174.1 integrase [Aliiruegeria haliotis]
MAGKELLSASFVRSAPVGKHCDGAGLWLHKRKDGGAQWVLRVTIHGKRREMGLGSFNDVSLKNARGLADHWRSIAKRGIDPIKQREREAREAKRADNTFEAIALEAFEAKKPELKGDGKAGRWLSPLENHVFPKLGKIPVAQLDQRDVKDALAPIWHSKADTARKALNRISIVLRHAAAHDLDVDLQVTEKAKLLLGKTRHTPKNIPALHWTKVPSFYQSLTEPSVTNLAMRLLILTGVRSHPLRFINLDQIDGDVWTIPSDSMKGLKGKTSEFRVPLSLEALKVIDLSKPFQKKGFLFPSTRKGVISDGTLAGLMKRQGHDERPHGFRSSLRTWLAEATDAPNEVCETILQHVSGSSVERAYRRTDFLEQRRQLMERWSEHLLGKSGQVVRLLEAN